MVQADTRSFSSHDVPFILQYCIYAYKQHLRFKTDKSVSVAYLQLSDVKNAPMPSDYEYFTKMAINLGGTFITLTRNQNLPLIRKYDECGAPKVEEMIIDPNKVDVSLFPYGYYYAPHFRAGQYVGEMYSAGGGENEAGYFREDWELRQFQFAGVPRTEILLEYVADTETSGSTMIPYSAVEPIRQYALWQMMEHDRRVPMAERQRAQDRFKLAMAEYGFIAWAWTAQEYMDLCWSTTKSGVKR